METYAPSSLISCIFSVRIRNWYNCAAATRWQEGECMKIATERSSISFLFPFFYISPFPNCPDIIFGVCQVPKYTFLLSKMLVIFLLISLVHPVSMLWMRAWGEYRKCGELEIRGEGIEDERKGTREEKRGKLSSFRGWECAQTAIPREIKGFEGGRESVFMREDEDGKRPQDTEKGSRGLWKPIQKLLFPQDRKTRKLSCWTGKRSTGKDWDPDFGWMQFWALENPITCFEMGDNRR